MVDAPTILLIEDDHALAAELSRALSSGAGSDCRVWHVETAADARAVLRQSRPDLIVLDLTLPDMDGLVFVAHLGTEAPDVPFMVCSAATTAERVLAFKLGAEDVIAKPFEMPELEARVEAVLRRHTRARTLRREGELAKASAAPPAHIGKLRVDLARWQITLDERPLALTPTEFQLLVFMTRRPGEIISREDLAVGVWGNEQMTRSRTIDAYVRRISAKLNGSGAPRILSIRGLGYQLAVPFASAA